MKTIWIRNGGLRWFFQRLSCRKTCSAADVLTPLNKSSKDGIEKEVEVVTSSLRADAVAAIGLNISRKTLWELSMDGFIFLNGSQLDKKSTKVKQGDVIEVDSFMPEKKRKGTASPATSSTTTAAEGGDNDEQARVIKRGRVVVKEIGPLTRRGKYKLLLLRCKHYKLFRVVPS